MPPSDSASPSPLPVSPLQQWLAPVTRFLHVEAASGIVLLACTVIALVAANSPIASGIAALWKAEVVLSLGGFSLTGDVGHLIVNDGLMTLFFFVVGLEVKREIVEGELQDLRQALLPVVGAMGGVVFPAAIYLALQWGEPGERGWAIPMATDIAFVVGFVALFGGRVPLGLKIFLLSLAIVDDLVAVLIIAFLFTDALSWGWLAAAAIAFAMLYGLDRGGVRQVGVYAFIGVFVWLAFLESGIHPTVAGVLLGVLTPAHPWVGRKTFADIVENTWHRIRGEGEVPHDRAVSAGRIEFAAREATSPLHRLESALHPWVAFVVMPLFALANAGVSLDAAGLRDPVAISVAAGLAVGKPAGILLLCAIAIRARLTSLPDGVTWPMLAAGACLAGIGFTMALFLNALAFPAAEFPEMEAAGKIGTLAGSLVSAVLGAILLMVALKARGVRTGD